MGAGLTFFWVACVAIDFPRGGKGSGLRSLILRSVSVVRHQHKSKYTWTFSPVVSFNGLSQW